MFDEIIELSEIGEKNNGRAGNKNLPPTEFRHTGTEWDTKDSLPARLPIVISPK